MAILQWKDKRAYAVYHENGKRRWVPLGKFQRKIDGQEKFVWHVKNNSKDQDKLAQFKDLEPDFWRWYQSEHSKVTCHNATHHWEIVKTEFGEDWIPGIDVKRIEEFKEKNQWGISTWKIRLILLKQFLSYAKRHGYKAEDPFSVIKIKQKQLHEYDFKAPPHHEMQALLLYLGLECDKKNFITALFLAYTGMRVIEFFRIGLEDIQSNRIRVFGKKKYRWIPLHPELIPYLEKLPLKHNDNALKCALQRACLKIWGCRNQITKGQFRHYFGTQLLRKTKNIRLVGQIMGHSSIQVTARYAWVLDDEQKEGVEMLD